ncbi:MAG: glutathione S-transferase N-terminal domain-containing protein [archaeon]
MIILWQFDGCPFCKKVMEKLTELSIDFVSITAPVTNESKREFLKKIGGKDQTPFIIDTDELVMMYESDEIIEFLEKNYGK